jgi:hypothetical protein
MRALFLSNVATFLAAALALDGAGCARQPCPATPTPTPTATATATPTPTATATATATPTRISVSFPSSLSATPLDGRVLVFFAKEPKPEPREQVSDADTTARVFGVDVDGLAPGAAATIDGATLGYPIASLASLPAGDYVVQAELVRYETFTRAKGPPVKLAPDRGEGRDWTKTPGNLVSAPRKVHVDPAAGIVETIALSSALPDLPPTPDTKYVKHVRIQSERLTKFWGRPTYLGAIVLLPEGWDTHPAAHYPLAIMHGHFPRDMDLMRQDPPDPSLPPVDTDGLRAHCPNAHEGAACEKYGYKRLQQETQRDFYRRWTGKGFPRVIALAIQHPTPFFDDSYAVNSDNDGPYGDAITYELVPYIEKTFRGLGPWARGMMGGSTGGWEALAAQVFYPEEYNGAIVNCPDPIDFRAYMTVNVYDDANAYWDEGPLRRTPRPSARDAFGRTRTVMEQDNRKELVLGTHGRSGEQWDAWEAVFSPMGEDGYPKRIWDRRTGVIDHEVAAWWREHYDLGHVMARDWARLAPLLRGKITINVGLYDNYFLNDAVFLVEDFFRKAQPPADATVDYGARDEHCWSGDHGVINAVSRLTYLDRFVPKLAQHWLHTAPRGADVTSWRY